jgi:hypothetical protein
MKTYFYTSIFFLLLNTVSIISQVGVFPQAVFLDMKNKSTNLTIFNSSEQSKEVTIDLKYGYPGYDSLGNTITILGDSLPEADTYSAIKYIKYFPKKLILKPKEEQVIKFMVSNVGTAKDGLYFGRVFVISKDVEKQIDSINTNNIQANIVVKYSLISAIFFQKGKNDCFVKASYNKVYMDSAYLNLMIDFDRSGTAPFLGSVEISIYDLDGNKIHEKRETTPIYFSSSKLFIIEKSKFKSSKYKVDLVLTNEHKEIPDDFKVPFTPVKTSFEIDLNGLLK